MPKERIVTTEHGHYEHATYDGKNTAGFKPIGDKVLVKPDKASSALGSKGLLVSTTDQQDRMSIGAITGVLVAVGDEIPPSNVLVPGTRVLFGRYQGQVFHGVDGESYRSMSAESIGGVFTEQ
jgi:co-chaperonin GroES (HSP10)